MSKAPYTPKLGDVFEKKNDGRTYRWEGYTGGGALLFVRMDAPNPATDVWLASERYILDYFKPVVNGVPRVSPDPVNQPQHYQFFPDLEAIEVIARSTTQEQFYGYCLGNRLKYRLRAGNKDKLEQDIAKSDKYLELYENYKGLCYNA